MRESKVTRTIKTTEATILCLDIDTAEPFNETFVLPRTYKKDSEILKAANAINDKDNVKLVHVVDVEIKEQLYGMTETEFLKHAKPIVKTTAEADAEN